MNTNADEKSNILLKHRDSTLHNVNPKVNSNPDEDFKSVSLKKKQNGEILIITYVLVLVCGFIAIFIANKKDFNHLMEQISNVNYVIIYTFFAILFYTVISAKMLDN